MNLFESASDKLNNLAKPPKSLGRLEYLAAKVAACQNTMNPNIRSARISVFAGDHGVARSETISPYPPSVTGLMFQTFKAGKAAINSIALANNVDVEIINCGVEGLTKGETLMPSKVPAFYDALIDGPTKNLRIEPALSDKALETAMSAGSNAASRAITDNMSVVGAGDMGIGNTTSATAIFSKLLNLNPQDITGPGTGLDHVGIQHKANIIREAVERIGDIHDPIEVLRQMGGFEIAAMTGFFLAVSKADIPILLDGFITTAAALVAIKIDPSVKEKLITSSISGEPAHRMILEEIGLPKPVFDLGLKLGEGTAACLAVPVLRAACHLINNTATLDEVLKGQL